MFLPNSDNYHKTTQKGAALVETVIVIGVLFILVIGLINIGSILWQITSASDGLRHGTRIAAQTTINNQMLPCTDLKIIADNATTEYVTSTLKIPQNVWEFASWDNGVIGSDICEIIPSDPINSITILRQKLRIKDTPNGTCLFCAFGIANKILPTVSLAFSLPGGCCYMPAGATVCSPLPVCTNS
jgi:hypothetical protein